MCIEKRVARNRGREVVIEIAATHPGIQHAHEVLAIRFQGNIEHRDFVSARSCDPGKQLDVALDSGYKFRIARLGKAKLMQGAKAIGVTVEDVIESQARFQCLRYGSTAPGALHTRT